MKKTGFYRQKVSSKQKIALVTFGLFLGLVMLEISLRIGGFTFLLLQEYRNVISIKQRGTYKIMCLGESTTELGGENSYPAQLERILNTKDRGVHFSVINKGICGIPTSYIVAHLQENINCYKPDMVITMMGIDDGGKVIPYDNNASTRMTKFLKNFRIYKLTRLLLSHIAVKLDELGIYKHKIASKDVFYSMPDESFGIQLPNRIDNYYKLAQGYLKSAKYSEAKQIFEKIILLDDRSIGAYTELAWLNSSDGNYSRAEEILQKLIKIDPGTTDYYWMLGNLYRVEGKYLESEKMFKEALSINSQDFRIYTNLGHLYSDQKRISESEAMFERAVTIAPSNPEVFRELGFCYREPWGRPDQDQIEKKLQKVIEMDINDTDTISVLGWLYLLQDRYPEAEKIFQRAFALNLNPQAQIVPGSIQGGLATIYQQQGNSRLANKYYQLERSLQVNYYDPITRLNYLGVKKILDKNKIKYVCVQYPVRSLEPLRKIFSDSDGVIFVDNENLFKKAIKKFGFKMLFTDMFGGDFGHCTEKGNKLLAENIANVILKEVFNK